MNHHFVAQLNTTHGPLKIGISNIPRDTIGPAFEALMSTLAQVSDPIVVEDKDANIDIYEVLDRSPEVALQFDYLGSKQVTFPNAEAFHDSMNEALKLNHFQCATSYDEKPDGSIDFVFETFLLVDQGESEH